MAQPQICEGSMLLGTGCGVCRKCSQDKHWSHGFLVKKIAELLAAGYTIRQENAEYHVYRSTVKLIIKMGHDSYPGYVIGRVNSFTGERVYIDKIYPLQLFIIRPPVKRASRAQAWNG